MAAAASGPSEGFGRRLRPALITIMSTPVRTPGRLCCTTTMTPAAHRILGRILSLMTTLSSTLLERSDTRWPSGDPGRQRRAGTQAIAQGGFDLLITDKNLPGTDGLEVLRQARQKQPAMQAIMVTGFPRTKPRSTLELASLATSPSLSVFTTSWTSATPPSE